MTDRRLVIGGLNITFDGTFSLNGLYSIIDSFLMERDYYKYEKLNRESIHPEGREIVIEMFPYKEISEYFKLTIKIVIKAFEITDIEVDHEGERKKINRGKIRIKIDGLLSSDIKKRWDKRPIFAFLKEIFERYTFRNQIKNAEDSLKKDVEDIYTELNKFLNI